MKLIEIINRRCNCKLSKISVVTQFGERPVYCETVIGEKFFHSHVVVNNIKLKMIYCAEEELNKDKLGLMTDILDIYIESRATWEIAEQISRSHELLSGKASLDEMIQNTVNTLVQSNLFDKAAVMFYNERLGELRGVFVAGTPKYTDEQVNIFKNSRIAIGEEVLKQLIECDKTSELSNSIEEHVELEDEVFKLLDNIKLKNKLIFAPMFTGEKIYGVLIVYSDDTYTNNHILTARSTARILNAMMMAVISNKKFEYTSAFYKELEAEMRNKQSLVTLGNYVATVAHEVKNPLISIGGFAQRLMKAVTGDDLKRMASIIATESVRLEHLTEDILSFSRKRPPVKTKICLKNLFDNIITLFETRITEENFKINVNVPDDVFIYADSDQIKQVIVNLIANAMNAMGKDGEVNVDYYEKQNKSYIEIKDSGGGIPLDVLPNLFKPFFTTSKGGTGLGLPISRKILNNHNGDLTVCNNDVGACFIITLPIDDKEEDSSEENNES